MYYLGLLVDTLFLFYHNYKVLYELQHWVEFENTGKL